MQQSQRVEHTRNQLVCFGEFELDLQSGELRCEGEVVALRPLATRCLLLLVSRPGRLVTMEEIRRELWGAAVVEWSAGIHQAIRQIRRALEDDGHEMVETVTRHGYRFRPLVTPAGTPRTAVSASGHRGLRGYAAGFATPIALLSLFVVWCGSLS